MSANQPIIEQMSNSIPSTGDVTDAAKNVSEGITQSISGAQETVQSSLNDFSNSAGMQDASSEFLGANGILAKFVFIILVLVAFMILMKVGISMLGYMLGPWSNPYLIKGALSGGRKAEIQQNPRDEDSAIIMRSNDRHKGIEFTWSIWLFIEEQNFNSKRKNIFVKGDPTFTNSDDINLLNGPGLYLYENETTPGTDEGKGKYQLEVHMDTLSGKETAYVHGVPIQKWFHVAIRMQNKVLDTYINGVVTDRRNLTSLPKQNFNNVTVHGNTGYSGTTSNLRYYNYALNVFEINNIIMFGPDLSPSSLAADSKALSGNYSFLASSWYGGNYDS
jgi:hypothetical protein